MGLSQHISRLWLKLTGTNAQFALEVRISHSLFIISIAALAYNVPLNLFIGLPIIALISFTVLCIFSYLYYRSRYLHKVQSSIVVFGLVGNLMFVVNFVYNSGTYGPTDILMALCIFLVLCVVPKKQQRPWLVFNIILITAVHVLEYYNPHFAPNSYTSKIARYIDLSSAYLTVVIVMYYTVTYLKHSYESEKRSASEKADAIEQKNQQILLQNQELERINSEKNKLMSIIAHDLRSPLSNIQNYLELVNEYELQTEERKLVEGDLLRVTRSTIDMLGKLLVWSKGQMDGVSVMLGYVALRDVLYNTIELEKAIAVKKNIELTADIDWDITIVADKDMLQLVIRNLVSNAIKFTPAGGKISCKAKQIGNECWLIIRDNGIGISPEKQAELFSLHAASTFGTENEKGVGLGLMLCKEYTELQGGRIWLESNPDEGTVFFVSMPAGKA